MGENGQLFLVIEYLEGGTIADFINNIKFLLPVEKSLKMDKASIVCPELCTPKRSNP